MDTLTFNSWLSLQITVTQRLMFSLYLLCCLVISSNNGRSSHPDLTSSQAALPTAVSRRPLKIQSRSQSHITTDSQSVSQSWCQELELELELIYDRQSVGQSVLVSGVGVGVGVNLRPTVSRPVCPGVRRPSGTCDQFFFLLGIYFRQLPVCNFVAPSLTRGRVCKLLYRRQLVHII
jgi:hypothetical protein